MKRKIRCGGKPMTVIVLAGGRGSRMRGEKAKLDVEGRTLLEHVISQVQPCFEDTVVSVSPGQRLKLPPAAEIKAGQAGQMAAKAFRGIRIVEDERLGLGPLGGILAGLKASRHNACAVVACDIPDINVSLLRALARAAGEAEISVPVGPAGHFEPLFAVYRRPIIPEIEALLRTGERSILPLFKRCRTSVVHLEDAGWLWNLNTRRDYESYLGSLAIMRAGVEGGIKSDLPNGGRTPDLLRMGRPRTQRRGRAERP